MTISPHLLSSARQAAGRAAAHFRLPLRSRVWKGAAGEFKGAGSGSSLDFQDHRSYVPGDDPRHINWQAYARTGQYTMKLYSEEVRPVIDVLLDGSESMFFDPTKSQRCCELLSFTVQAAHRSGAALNVHLLTAKSSKRIPLESLQTDRWADLLMTDPEPSPGPPALETAELRPGALRILISDLLFSADPLPLVRTLTAQNSSAVIFSPFLKSEASPDWDGNYDFKDVEAHTRHPHRITRAALTRYLTAYRGHFNAWQEAALRHQVNLVRLPAEPDLVKVLAETALRQGALEI